GSLPVSFAICAIVLFSYFLFVGLRAFTRTTPPQPPAASTMFHQPGDPVVISLLSRARIDGLASRARSESAPPSCAQLGIVASRPVPPPVETYMCAATSTPRAP